MTRQKPWQSRIVAEGEEAPDQLLANPMNWRIHGQFQQEAVGQALNEVGWISRVIVNQVTGHVIDGHLRVSLAISRGEKSVPVSYVKLSPDEERLAIATFDPLSALAVGDPGVLKELLSEVTPFVEDGALADLLMQLKLNTAAIEIGDITPQDEALQPPLTEEEATALDERDREFTEATPDRMETLRRKWDVSPGSVWRIHSRQKVGAVHTLVVGLAERGFHPIAMERAMVVTSPPYGTGQVYEHPGEWESVICGFLKSWHPLSKAMMINLADVVVSATPGREEHSYGFLVAAARQVGCDLVATRIWRKDPTWEGANTYWINSYKPVHEFEYVGLFADLQKFYSGGFTRVSERIPQSEDWRFRGVWDIKSVASQSLREGKHPAAFPLELPRRCILLTTEPGETVADPFLGSGTTMVAAEHLGRVCVGVERDPAFAAVALERLANMGLQVERA